MEKTTVRNKRLYLEDLTVSFDGFKALNKLTLCDLMRRHAGNRLVNQEQLRILHQQHAN